MTKDKERDDALIARAHRLTRECGYSETDAAFTKIVCETAIALLRGDEQPKPDRAEVLFDDLYGKTKDEQIDCFRRHFAELRAEWEAERLEIPPHKHYSTPLIERLNGPHEWGYRDPVEGGFIADMSPFEASDRLSELEAERPAVVVPEDDWNWACENEACEGTTPNDRLQAASFIISQLDGAKGDE